MIIADPSKSIKKLKEKMQLEEYIDYSRLWLRECKRVLKVDGTLYIYMDIIHIIHIYDILLREFNMNFINWISWEYISMKKMIPFNHDDILMFSKSTVCNFYRDNEKISLKFYQKENNMKEPGFGNIWRFSLLYNSKSTRKIYQKQKAEALIEKLISDSIKIGDTVLDLYSGSSTTLSACQKLNRNCIGIEFNLNSYEQGEVVK